MTVMIVMSQNGSSPNMLPGLMLFHCINYEKKQYNTDDAVPSSFISFKLCMDNKNKEEGEKQ